VGKNTQLGVKLCRRAHSVSGRSRRDRLSAIDYQTPPHRGEINNGRVTSASCILATHYSDHIMVCAHGRIGTSSAPRTTRRPTPGTATDPTKS